MKTFCQTLYFLLLCVLMGGLALAVLFLALYLGGN